MTANFWTSTQAQRWILTRTQLLLAREEDLRYANPEEVGAIGIWCANAVSLLCKRLQLRQRVIATASVYLKRFYAKNSYCSTDPCLVITACVYVASKAEESPVHIRSVVAEATRVWADMGYRSFPTSSSTLAEMEFYLLEDLEFDLIVHHPYRTLVQIANSLGRLSSTGDSQEGSTSKKRKRPDDNKQMSETDKDLGLDQQPSNSGGDGKDVRLDELDDPTVQMAWFVLNDTYRADIPLLYPPHLIAIASIFLALVLHPPACEKLESSYEEMNQARRNWEKKVQETEKARFEAAQQSAAAQAQASAAAPTGLAGSIGSTTATIGLGIGAGTSKATGASPEPLTPARSADSPKPPYAASPSLVGGGGTSGGGGAGSLIHQMTASKPPVPPMDALTVLASMNVSLPLVAEIVQEMISSYELWHRVSTKEPHDASKPKGKRGSASTAEQQATSQQSKQQTSKTASTESDDAFGASFKVVFAEIQPGGTAPSFGDLVGDSPAMLKRIERMREARRKEIRAKK